MGGKGSCLCSGEGRGGGYYKMKAEKRTGTSIFHCNSGRHHPFYTCPFPNEKFGVFFYLFFCFLFCCFRQGPLCS